MLELIRSEGEPRRRVRGEFKGLARRRESTRFSGGFSGHGRSLARSRTRIENVPRRPVAIGSSQYLVTRAVSLRALGWGRCRGGVVL